jgi:hypothetical protein
VHPSPSNAGASAHLARARRLAARWSPLAVAATVPALLFLVLPPLGRSGILDYELGAADLARRIALNLHHAAGLALEGADNSLPHLNDLGRPQLPLSSIAVGFGLFGLHEWAGRLPLALWGLTGALATYAFVARLFDPRTGAYASVVLATMPLYFVQARFMLGDVCTMAGLAMAFGGLAVACFDSDERGGPTRVAARIPWLAMAVVGLFVGFESRGALLGVGVPTLAVGLAWGVGRLGSRTLEESGPERERGSRTLEESGPERERGSRTNALGDALGALSLLAGLGLVAMAARAIASRAAGSDLDMWVGAILRRPEKYPTFDVTLGAVGHALAPWSAFLPLSLGRLCVAPPSSAGFARERESLGRVAIVVGVGVAIAAHGYLAVRADAVPFVAPTLCAAACAVALRDFERGARASMAVGVGTLVLAAVLHHDFHERPEKALVAFGVADASFPPGLRDVSTAVWWVVLGGFAVSALLAWAENDVKRRPFDPAAYGSVLRVLSGARKGRMWLGAPVVIVGASVAALVVWVAPRLGAHSMPALSSTMRDVVLHAWWVLAFVPVGLVLVGLLACDGWLWAFSAPTSVARGWRAVVARLVGATLRHRAAGLLFGGAIAGFVLCFFYYPVLADQLSPRDVYATYRQACPGAPVGLLGVSGRAAAYYGAGRQLTFGDAPSAFRWLMSGGAERRCLATTAKELPRLNRLWRERPSAATKDNLPVLDARPGQVLLAASFLAGNEANRNELDSVVLASAPPTQHRLAVNLDDTLEVVGLDVVDPRGRPVSAVRPGQTVHLRITYRVLARVANEWRPFVHIDGQGRRKNADHDALGGKYPMSEWLPGDVVVDDTELALEPNFTPGVYTIWFGLAAGDRCGDRLRVASGPSDGCNRINGGPLRVQ